MPGGFLLDEDARSARLSEFDNWVEEQKKKAEDTANAAQQTVQTTVAPVQAAVSQAPATAQTAVQDAAQAVTQGPSEALQRFDAWVAQQQQQAAAARQQQAAAPAPVATIPTPAPAPSPTPAPTDTTTAPEVSPLERFDTWAAQQKQAAQDAASGVGQAVGGAADAAGTAAQGALPHAEEPATATDQAPTAGAAVGGPDLGKNWKTQFDFGAVYTGDYRTGTPHRGVDLVPSNGKGIGTEVDAFAPGTVTNIFRDPGGAGGLIVYVQDADGLTHAYMHLAGTQPGLQVGTQVQRGTPIAMMGESGTEGSPHLHYEVRKNASNGDPLNQLIDPRVYVSGDKQPGGTAAAQPSQPTAAPATSAGTSQATNQAGPSNAIDASSPTAFAKSMAPYAQYAAQKLGIDPTWVAAMAASESNYGKADAAGHELFGVKALPGQKGTTLMTHEGQNGGVNMNQDFAAYDSPLAAVDAWIDLIQNHYKGAVNAKDLPTFIHGLRQGGYFTAGEQEYLNIVQGIQDRIGGDVTSAIQSGGDALGAAGQAVGGAASAVGTAASNAGKTALDAATSASGQVAQRAQDVMNQGKTQLQLLQDQTAQLQADFNALQDKLRAAQDAAAKQNEQYRTGLEQQVNQSRQDILAPRDFSGTLNAANQMGQDIMGSGAARAVGSAFDQAPSPLGGTLGSNVRDAQTAVQEAPSNLGQGLQAANTEAQRQQNQDSVLTTAARTGLNLAGRDLSPQAAQALNTATPPMLQQADLGGAVSTFLKSGNVVPASQTVNLPFIGVTPVADIIGLAANLVTPVGAEERFAGSASQRALDRAAFEVAQRSQAGVGGMLERPGVQAAWASALGSTIGEGSTAARLAMSGVGRWARASVQEIASDLAQGPIARLVTDETGTLDVDKLTQIAQTVKDEMVRMYHGTGSGFASADPARMAGEENLYGPGHYLTSSPEVAGGVVSKGQFGIDPETGRTSTYNPTTGKFDTYMTGVGDLISPGYAQARARLTLSDVADVTDRAITEVRGHIGYFQRRTLADLEKLRSQIPGFANNPQFSNPAQYAEANLTSILGRDSPNAEVMLKKLAPDIYAQGGNVRPVNVPKDLNLLDVDAPLKPDDRTAIVDALRSSGDPRDAPVADQFEQYTSTPGATAQNAYDALANVNKGFANKVLADAGFDGISYAGGQRIPMRDAQGDPIQHQATVIFPESVTKVRNALSDEAGSIGVGAGMRLGGGAAGLLGSENTMSPEDKQDPWGRFSRDLGATLLGAAAPGAVGALARGGVNYRDLAALRPGTLPTPTRPGLTPAQAFSAFTKQNLLSSPKTHVTNIISQLAELAHMPLSSLAGGHEEDAVAGVRAAGQAVPDALRNFAKTLQTGETQFSQSQGATSKWLPALRMLGATDDFFKTVGWAMGAGTEGQRILRESGAGASGASSVLGSSAARINAAGDKAANMSVFGEGGSAAGDAISREKSRLMASPSYKDQALGLLLDAGVPFSTVPGRIWNTGIQRMPGVGELNALRKAGIAIQSGDQAGFQKAMGDAAVKSVISASIISNIANGNIRGPDDKEHPSGIKLNGQWYDYSSWGAWTLPIALPAAWYESVRQEGNKPTPDVPKAIFDSTGKALENQFYAADIMKTLSQVGSGGGTSAAGQIIGGYADRVLPDSGALNEATTLFDPIMRNPTNKGLMQFVQREQAKIPGLEALLPPKPEMTTGEPQQRMSSGAGQLIGMQTRPSSPMDSEVARLERSGYKIPDPTQIPTSVSLRGHQIALTEDEGRKLAVKRGQLINEALGGLVGTPEWTRMDDNDKAMTLNRAMSRIDGRNAALWADMTPDAEVDRRVNAGYTVVGKLEPQAAAPPVLAGSR